MVKICGITNTADAEAAIECGADLLGLILVPSTPRCVSVEQAREIVTAVNRRVRTFAVLMNPQTASEVFALVTKTACDGVQLHGNEPPKLLHALRSMPIIKTITVGDSADVPRVELPADAHTSSMLLFDRPKNTPAAARAASQTQTLPMSVADIGKPSQPYLIAGGITPENAAAVCRQFMHDRNFRGIDVASGVERAPGQKDQAKIAALIESVREACSDANIR